MLAYDVRNYAVASKPYNPALKSNYSPVAGRRARARREAASYKTQQPFLIYPIGASDTDPETLWSFVGFVPAPAARLCARHRRARDYRFSSPR